MSAKIHNLQIGEYKRKIRETHMNTSLSTRKKYKTFISLYEQFAKEKAPLKFRVTVFVVVSRFQLFLLLNRIARFIGGAKR
ncbi:MULTISPECIES: hypothetical protein [Bacillus subtilis group]|uniref:hypothetical protein n=1 Tax=Bacillus subtilis group TaxID=653685 RepID=UPI002E221F0E|nr:MULTISPECIES: hypothetical protein [Bacillus subtilis group]MED1190408.1 hypothetical protein [Bacillus paralicheniformis]MED4302268.1 hypothetical protein [Bacillus licheniformis]MED4374052.1 hypothetical protein [Bacillus licheniformis]